jgi:hypothetical protein
MNPIQQRVLDTIAAGESHNYTTLYGGHQFTSFVAHPGIEIKLPGGGETSAAGRYQFEKGTWAGQAKRLGLVDFSPDSQDAAAWDLANRTYQQVTGRSLEADQIAGHVQWTALGKQWPSLERFAPARVAGPGATKIASAPWSPPDLSSTQHGPELAAGSNNPLALRAAPEANPQHVLETIASTLPGHTTSQVDYDPFTATREATNVK